MCFNDALHHWPMDKLDGGGMADIVGSQHGHIVGEYAVVNSGPIVHSGFSTAAISLKGSSLDRIDLGDFSAVQMMNLDWEYGECLLHVALLCCVVL
jgi:hypothetical protein